MDTEKKDGLLDAWTTEDGLTVYRYGRTDSTNLRAKEAAYSHPNGALFIAKGQSAGRGRLGRSFYSPDDTGLYFSCLYQTESPLYLHLALTPAVAVVCARAIEKYCEKKVGIKWVNDLYYEGKKVCGILVESVCGSDGQDKNGLIVGVGINLQTVEFPGELSGIAGSLGVGIDCDKMALDIYRTLERYVLDPSDRSFMKEYTERSILLSKPVKLLKGEECICGTVIGFDCDGGIVLDIDGERKAFHGGEITLRLQ
ncbi:MAG: biotin--[acetyl-CoA-carboxylase] ligase [Clostridia bacterium]|nr:biotin--[acetyl-CoA-carboxylase] ligase [Clostridia bacterium]